MKIETKPQALKGERKTMTKIYNLVSLFRSNKRPSTNSKMQMKERNQYDFSLTDGKKWMMKEKFNQNNKNPPKI